MNPFSKIKIASTEDTRVALVLNFNEKSYCTTGLSQTLKMEGGRKKKRKD